MLLFFLNKIYKQQHPTTQTPAHFLEIIRNNPVFARWALNPPPPIDFLQIRKGEVFLLFLIQRSLILTLQGILTLPDLFLATAEAYPDPFPKHAG